MRKIVQIMIPFHLCFSLWSAWGEDMRALTLPPAPQIFSIAASPTEPKVFFISNIRTGDAYEPSELFVVDLSTKQIQPLSQPLNFCADSGCIDVSPDGSTLACCIYEGPYPSIYFINTDGSNLRKFTNDEFGGSHPVWSPDGNFLAITTKRPGLPSNPGILIVDKNGNDIGWVITAPAGGLDSVCPFAWAPNGSYLIFVKDEYSVQFRGSRESLWRADIDLTKPFPWVNFVQLADLGAGILCKPVISPDSSRVVFPLTHELLAINVDGSGQTIMCSLPEDFLIDEAVFLPQWNKIVLVAMKGYGPQNIYLVNPDGTGLEQITFFTGFLARGQNPNVLAKGKGKVPVLARANPTNPPLKKETKSKQAKSSPVEKKLAKNIPLPYQETPVEDKPKSRAPLLAGGLSLSALGYAIWKFLKMLS